MSLIDMVMGEMHERKAYLYDTYTPFFVCSYIAHAFNLLNRRDGIYWEGKRLPSMRCHLMFVAPPGYMKSYYMNNMGEPDSGIFSGTKIQMGFKQSMTEAGLIGTIRVFEEVPYETEGVAKTYKDGILMVDEFSAITNAFKISYNNQMDSQLLALLDHGRVNKDLAGGSIEYQSNLTLWGGVQPARYDFTSGMGRRMVFMLFLPTRVDNDNLLEVMDTTRNMKCDPEHMRQLWNDIDQWVEQIGVIKSLEFDSSVLRLYKRLGLNSFESPIFDRLLLGYHLAKYEAESSTVIGADDKEVIELVQREKKWRDDIVKGIPFIQIKRIIAMSGQRTDGIYTLSKMSLIDEASMLGWNAQQVTELVQEMAKTEMVRTKGGQIMMEEAMI
jgi:hypothetical protein